MPKLNSLGGQLYDTIVSDRQDIMPNPRQLYASTICEEDGASSSSSTSTSTNTGGGVAQTKTNVASVYLRLRPNGASSSCCNQHQYSLDTNVFKMRCDSNAIGGVPHKEIVEKRFSFSRIFNENTDQATIYDTCVHSSIEDEQNLTILTYGTSGSGKTHTLLGAGDLKEMGIIPRAIEHIFRKYQNLVQAQPEIKVINGNIEIVDNVNLRVEHLLRKAALRAAGQLPNDYAAQIERIGGQHDFDCNQPTDGQVYVWISFAEIYNEHVYDLLEVNGSGQEQHKENNSTMANGGGGGGASKTKALKVIVNDGHAYIKDLTSIHVRSSSEAFLLLTSGRSRVTYASTMINKNSSRSHCIFFVNVIQIGDDLFKQTMYKFCDLAGSERQKKTDNTGERLKEAQSINNSLMVLGRCLDAVYKKKTIVPFRESKLTTLLQAPLLGKEKITMIVNMLATSDFHEENLNVLNFASMAQQIVYKPPPVVRRGGPSARYSWFISKAASSSPKEMGNTSQISFLMDENDRLKMENEELQIQLNEELEQREARENQIRLEHRRRLAKANALWEQRMKLQEKSLESNRVHTIEQLKRKYESKIEELTDENKRLRRKVMGESTSTNDLQIVTCLDSDEDDNENVNDSSGEENDVGNDNNGEENDKENDSVDYNDNNDTDYEDDDDDNDDEHAQPDPAKKLCI